MQRATAPQAPADVAPPASLSDDAALHGELHALAQGLRAHLLWLQDGGVSGLPRPQPVARRAPAPEPAHRPERPERTEHADRARPPAPPDLAELDDRAPPPRTDEPYGYAAAEHMDMDGAAAALRALEVTARAAGASVPRRSAPSAPEPRIEPRADRVPPPPSGAPVAELVTLRTDGKLTGAAGLAAVREVLGDCQRCKLCHGRTTLVYGEGSPAPLIAFVGEGPGADEDRQGRPFVGAAGELLNRMIKAMANEAAKQGRPDLAARLAREQVYIANVVKCRPPGNRTPEPDEIAACGGFLQAQLECLKPHVKVLVALGRTPTQFLLQSGAPISRVRGQFHRVDGMPVMPTYHPAYLLRTESAKKQTWDDLKQVLGLLLAEVPPT